VLAFSEGIKLSVACLICRSNIFSACGDGIVDFSLGEQCDGDVNCVNCVCKTLYKPELFIEDRFGGCSYCISSFLFYFCFIFSLLIYKACGNSIAEESYGEDCDGGTGCSSDCSCSGFFQKSSPISRYCSVSTSAITAITVVLSALSCIGFAVLIIWLFRKFGKTKNDVGNEEETTMQTDINRTPQKGVLMASMIDSQNEVERKISENGSEATTLSSPSVLPSKKYFFLSFFYFFIFFCKKLFILFLTLL